VEIIRDNTILTSQHVTDSYNAESVAAFLGTIFLKSSKPH
jgi:hypothetical protein